MIGTKKRAKIHYVVQCDRHGVSVAKAVGKSVKMAKPIHKRDRMGGCPICAAEAKV